MTTSERDPELRERALVNLRKKREFLSHLFLYLIVNAILVGIWAMTGGGSFWPIWSILGWGIGVFFHGWDVYARPPSEERIRREMDRLGER
jgi:2TM domain